MSTTTSNNSQTNPQKICQKHSQPITYICSQQTCKDKKYICQKCKTKDTLHFSHHGTYIYSLKQFYQFDNAKLLLPRLQKGVNDCQNYINNHKRNYQQQLSILKEDFKSIKDQFLEISEKFQQIYIQQFSKQMNKFDQKMLSIKATLRQFSKQKSSQGSFFTILFSNDSHKKSIDQILQKNAKAFKVRADIIDLRSDIAQAKVSTSKYKGNVSDQLKFADLKQYFIQIITGFYNKFKDFLSVSSSSGLTGGNTNSNLNNSGDNLINNQNSSKRNSTLRQSIVNQTKNFTSLKSSRVMQNNSNVTSSPNTPKNSNLVMGQRSNSLTNQLENSTVTISTDRNSNNFIQQQQQQSLQQFQKIKTYLPQPHPIVQKIIAQLRPLPAEDNNRKQQGPYKYPNGVYFGQYQTTNPMIRQGKGIFVYSNGCYYQGSWQNDNMCGYGRLIKIDCFYQGQIKDGKAHGKGTYQDAQRTYSGQWRDDKRHGLGQQQFKKGKKRKYVGLFLNDKYQGRGKLIDQDFYYQGTFKDGLFHGQNCLIKYQNGQVYHGYFDNGNKHFGKMNFLDGSCYQGKFYNDMPHGPGDFYWPDGIIFSGQWKEGKQDGIGKMSFKDGRILNGVWKNGNWVKWI